MSIARNWRRLLLGLLTGLALAVAGVSVPVFVGSLTPAMAQVPAEFQAALESYGAWRRHPRFGEVWVPSGLPRDWRPYEFGHWIYTDEWGWYWISDDAEADWGWVTYHYGRWAFERRLGWFWVPGEDWAPAWVAWRYGDDYVGWAPLPPDELIEVYEDAPAPWIFVSPRFMTAPRLRSFIVPPQRRAFALRASRVVNRTMRIGHGRLAVNPGLAPGFVARMTGAALPAYRVRPRVIAGTQGVVGAVFVRPQDQRGHDRVFVERTTVVVPPSATPAAPQALGKSEHGRLGSHPPRAAQGAAAPPPQKQAPASSPPATALSASRGEPPPPSKPGSRQAPAVAQPAPPLHPVPPAVKPAAPPKAVEAKKPPVPRKPGEKPEKPEEKR